MVHLGGLTGGDKSLETSHRRTNKDDTTRCEVALDHFISASLRPTHPLTLFLASWFRALKSFATDAALPLKAAQCSGMFPSCGARHYQARNPPLLASACAPSRTCAPLGTTPPEGRHKNAKTHDTTRCMSPIDPSLSASLSPPCPSPCPSRPWPPSAIRSQ